MLKELQSELERLAAMQQLKTLSLTGVRSEGRIEIRNHKLIDFANWDLLNLSQEPRFRRSIHEEIEEVGIGSGSARLNSGTLAAHLGFEHHLAKFLGVEAALLFSSRNQAVLSLISALVSEVDLVLIDELVQAPIIDAAFLVGANLVTFQSSNPESLSRELEKSANFKRKFVFVESVSTLTCRISPLSALVDTCQKYGAHLILDESFALGVLGLRGAGGVEEAKLQSFPFCQFGSLSGPLASYGAFVAGSQVLVGYILNRSRTFLYESAFPACLARGAETALRLVESKQVQRLRVTSLAQRLLTGLSAILGQRLAGENLPMVVLTLDDRKQAHELVQALFTKGYYVEFVPLGREAAVVQFILQVSHTERDVDGLCEAVAEIYTKFKT